MAIDNWKTDEVIVLVSLPPLIRILRPGGLFVFSEPDGDDSFLELLYKVSFLPLRT